MTEQIHSSVPGAGRLRVGVMARPAGVVVIVLSGLFITACGPGASPTPSTPNASGGVKGSVPASTGTSQTAQRHSGIALVTCPTQDVLSINFLSPDSGQSTSQLTVEAQLTGGPSGQLTTDFGVRCGTGGGAFSLHTREQFDAGFGRVAVTTGKLADGSQHIGYVDLANKQFVDLSGSGGSGFSSAIAIDSEPVFSPGGAELWFLRDGKDIYSTDLSGGHLTKRFSPPPPPNAGDPRFLVEPGTNQPIVYNPDLSQFRVLPNPSGNIAVAPLADQRPGIRVFTHPEDTFADPQKGSSVGMPNVGMCEPDAWIDDVALLCDTSGSPPQLLITKVRPQSTSATATAFLPPNQRQNFSPVVSPDRTSVAFLSKPESGTTTSLYVTSTTSATEPHKVIDLPPSGFTKGLLGWY